MTLVTILEILCLGVTAITVLGVAVGFGIGVGWIICKTADAVMSKYKQNVATARFKRHWRLYTVSLLTLIICTCAYIVAVSRCNNGITPARALSHFLPWQTLDEERTE